MKPNPTSVPIKVEEKSEPIAETTPCYYENETSSLGIGLVISIDDSKPLEIYDDVNLIRLFTKFDIYSGKPLEICAKYNKPDYGILHFVCLDSSDNYYKILVNHSDVKYISRSESGYNFISWTEYITTAFSARMKRENRTNYIIEIPNDSSDIIEIPNDRFQSFCVVDVLKDWLEVKYNCFYGKPDNPYELTPCEEFIDECELPSGWIRWRRDNKVLVELPHLS